MAALTNAQMEQLVAAVLTSGYLAARDTATTQGTVDRYRRILAELRQGGLDAPPRRSTTSS